MRVHVKRAGSVHVDPSSDVVVRVLDKTRKIIEIHSESTNFEVVNDDAFRSDVPGEVSLNIAFNAHETTRGIGKDSGSTIITLMFSVPGSSEACHQLTKRVNDAWSFWVSELPTHDGCEVFIVSGEPNKGGSK